MRLCLMVFLVACHSTTNLPAEETPDAALDAPILTVDAAPDATVCTAHAPAPVSVTIASITPQPLALDGNGFLCDQLTRAILDPLQRPPELAPLDATSGVGSPLCTEFPKKIAVRIDINEIMGRPLLSGGQWLLAWVDRDTHELLELTGWYLVPPAAPPTACATGDMLQAAVVGHEQVYSTFQWCAPTGEGTWTVSATDSRILGDEGWYFDGAKLVAAREIDIAVAPAAITQQLRDSDLNCCGVIDAVDCIGLRLIVDAQSGKVLDQRRHCIVC